MSTRTCQTQNHLPMRHRQEPIREGLAWWCKIPASESPPLRKIRGFCSKTNHRNNVMNRLTGLVVKLNGRATLRIPIALYLFRFQKRGGVCNPAPYVSAMPKQNGYM